MKEIWKPVVGYENRYLVSNLGQVKSLNYQNTGKTHMMSRQVDKHGYLSITLYDGIKHKRKLVHRLVAEAFIDNPNNYGFVNHKDEDKKNPSADNLEWCTKSYNAIYYLEKDVRRKQEYANRFKDKDGKSLSPMTKHIPKKYNCKVKQSTLDGVFLKEFENASIASVETNSNISNLLSACHRNERTDRKQKRKRKASHNGYVWEFITE